MTIKDPSADAADAKTLALTRPELTAARLEQFIQYQRAVLAHGGSSFAHSAARDAGTLDEGSLARIASVVADFAGKRWTIATLRRRRGELRATGEKPEALGRLEERLGRLEDLTALERRYGKQIVELLLSREAELVELHEALQARP